MKTPKDILQGLRPENRNVLKMLTHFKSLAPYPLNHGSVQVHPFPKDARQCNATHNPITFIPYKYARYRKTAIPKEEEKKVTKL